MYLELLKKRLIRWGEDAFVPLEPTGSILTRQAKRAVKHLLAMGGLEAVRRVPFDATKRESGRDWPCDAETMIGLKRLDNLQYCIETVLAEGVPGDLIETGVWRGGASIFMAGALRAFGDEDRLVWCADSFQGLPAPDLTKYPQDKDVNWHTQDELAVPLERVKENFRKYGLLDDRVKFLVGWFRDTLPPAPIDRLSVLRLDGDMYESTMDALNSLYGKLSPRGFVIVDDYGIPEDTCRQAVRDFRSERGIDDPIMDIDGFGAFWRKSA